MHDLLHLDSHGLHYSVAFARWTRPASWTLSHGELEVHHFAATSDDTAESVIQACRQWLGDNCFHAKVFEETFYFYRLARDFFRPVKEDPEDFISWLVCEGDRIVMHLPIPPASTHETAVRMLEAWLRQNPLRCSGGPLDGRRVPYQGDAFRPRVLHSELTGGGPASEVILATNGSYIRTEHGYTWQPSE